MMDRIAPTRRPDRRPAGYQRWRSLLFMHWEVPVAAMRAIVPRPLELDLFEGRLFVGVVPFAMQGVRAWWWPERAAFDFLETNVRTYVHWRDQPGVYFLSLEAASWLAVQAARLGWGLPYHFARMSLSESDGEFSYQTRRASNGSSHRVRYRVGEELGPSQPGSIEHFLVERYLLFVAKGSQVRVGQVHHVPYPLRRARVLEVEDQLVAAASLPSVSGLPELAHYSPGVDVEVFPLVTT